MKNRAALLFLLSALALPWLLSGCARAPKLGEPIDASELAALVARLTEGLPEGVSFRGVGEAEIKASGRTLRLAFAVIHERPGWLRADLRPALGTMGASLTAQALVDAGCANLYFPARLIEVTGCLSDVVDDAGQLDAAGLFLGLPDPTLLAGLEEPELFRSGGTITIAGHSGASLVTVSVNETDGVIEKIQLGTAEDDSAVSVTYEGHGWKQGLSVPETVRVVAGSGTSREIEIGIRYNSLRAAEAVDRSQYALEVPAGVPSIDWKELSIWR